MQLFFLTFWYRISQMEIDWKIYPFSTFLLIRRISKRHNFLPHDGGDAVCAVHELRGTWRNKEQIFESICVCISFKTVFDFLVCHERNPNSTPSPTSCKRHALNIQSFRHKNYEQIFSLRIRGEFLEIKNVGVGIGIHVIE